MIRSSVPLAALLIGLAGCATTTDAGQPSLAGPSSEGHRAKVTASDYEAAVRRLDVCLKESGIELINDGWDPVDNERMILRFNAPGMAYDEVKEITDRCQSIHLAPVAAKYNEDNRSHMASELMTAVQACLKNKKIDLTGREENPQDLLVAVPQNRHEELRSCVRESVRRLYPDLLSTAFP